MKVTTDACLFGAWCAEELKKEKVECPTILDIGSGTGLLSMMLAQQCESQVLAVEIDPAAAGQAAFNFSLSPWASRLKLLHADICYQRFEAPFDCIVSNPPFYEKELKGPDTLRNTAHHGTMLSLDGLFGIVYEQVTEEGIIFLLLPAKRKTEIEKLLEKNKLHIRKELQVHPTENHPATRWMIALSKHPVGAPTAERINIRERNGYSERFATLLAPYYLQI